MEYNPKSVAHEVNGHLFPLVSDQVRDALDEIGCRLSKVFGVSRFTKIDGLVAEIDRLQFEWIQSAYMTPARQRALILARCITAEGGLFG